MYHLITMYSATFWAFILVPYNVRKYGIAYSPYRFSALRLWSDFHSSATCIGSHLPRLSAAFTHKLLSPSWSFLFHYNTTVCHISYSISTSNYGVKQFSSAYYSCKAEKSGLYIISSCSSSFCRIMSHLSFTFNYFVLFSILYFFSFVRFFICFFFCFVRFSMCS